MDSTERLVQDYLLHCCFTSVLYEPDGNVPPDFSIEGRIAVEARRLNQHERSQGFVRGLEETAIPFGRTVRQVLKNSVPHKARRVGSWPTAFNDHSLNEASRCGSCTMRWRNLRIAHFWLH